MILGLNLEHHRIAGSHSCSVIRQSLKSWKGQSLRCLYMFAHLISEKKTTKAILWILPNVSIQRWIFGRCSARCCDIVQVLHSFEHRSSHWFSGKRPCKGSEDDLRDTLKFYTSILKRCSERCHWWLLLRGWWWWRSATAKPLGFESASWEVNTRWFPIK